ncbi:hypothetical protein TWF694_002407 [Orbilia ellipsospora]|uniref:Aminodeoxychorismate lyase n=1 Tax=Orbilia ellipsospora TaxID=2528407 RepID=A0AAV9X1V6_9PEZI
MTSTEDPPFHLFSSLQYSKTLLTQDENTRLNNGQPSPYSMLPYHRDRILNAARNFGWDAAVSALESSNCLDDIQKKCDEAVEKVLDGVAVDERDEVSLRIRVIISQSGALTTETFLISSLPQASFFPQSLNPETHTATTPNAKIYKVYLDTQSTLPSDLTRYKTTARKHYDDARIRVGITNWTDAKEVILWSSVDDMVMEGSITNVYFYRPGKGGWITPTTPIPTATSTPSTASGGSKGGLGAGGTAGTVRRWLLEQGMVTVGDVKRDEVVVGEWVWLTNGVKGVILGRIEEVEIDK